MESGAIAPLMLMCCRRVLTKFHDPAPRLIHPYRQPIYAVDVWNPLKHIKSSGAAFLLSAFDSVQ